MRAWKLLALAVGWTLLSLGLGAVPALADEKSLPDADYDQEASFQPVAATKHRLAARTLFGFGGKVSSKSKIGGESARFKDDLDPTFGAGVDYDFPYVFFGVLRLGLGLEVRAVRADDATEDTIALLPTLRIRAEYPLLGGKLYPFGEFNIGLGMAFSDAILYDGKTLANPAFGAGVELLGGVEYMFIPAFGATLSLGYLYTGLQGSIEDLDVDSEISADAHQFMLNLGVVARF